MGEDDNDGPFGRPHHGSSYEVPPIVSPALLDPAARRRLHDRLRQLAERRQINRSTLLVGSVLVELSRITGAVFPTLATIARRAFCVVRTVQRALAQLRDLGVLTWIRRIVRLPDGRGVQTSNSYVLEAPPAPSAPPQEQSRPVEPLRLLRKVGNKLEKTFMAAMSTGKTAQAATMTRIEAERALKAARERPQLRLHLLKGRMRPG